jgi:hypothetical protein
MDCWNAIVPLCSHAQLLEHVLWGAISNDIKRLGFLYLTPIHF